MVCLNKLSNMNDFNTATYMFKRNPIKRLYNLILECDVYYTKCVVQLTGCC